MSDDAPALRERIPDRIEDLTPSWLTGALRERGLLGDGWVRDVKHEVLGVGEGFMGVVARLHLYYEGERGIAPLTLIAKLPTDVAQNRIMGEVLGAYWREIHFYEEQADTVPVTTPRLYHAALTPDPRREKQDEILALLDRVPGWLIGALYWRL